MAGAEPSAVIAAVRGEVEAGVDRVLTEAEACLAAVAVARTGSSEALDRLEAGLCAIMEACAFQDLTGQRLTVLARLIEPDGKGLADDGLLNGPALDGGLDQTAADQLMAPPPPDATTRST